MSFPGQLSGTTNLRSRLLAAFLPTLGMVLFGWGGAALSASASESEAAKELASRGFTVLADEVGFSGRQSSYHGKSLTSNALQKMPEFGSEKVRFSNGEEPSPGGRTGGYFDEGVLAYKMKGNSLVLAVACGLNPKSWLSVEEFRGALYGQGDLFLAVKERGKVSHFALLNEMHGRRPLGHDGFWDRAQEFRYGPDVSIGELVRLSAEDHIQTAGGYRGHSRGGQSPRGLDERVFARGGKGLGVGELVVFEVKGRQPMHPGNKKMTWYVSEWTLPLEAIGRPEEVSFHIGTTCGNDQISGTLKLRRRPEIN